MIGPRAAVEIVEIYGYYEGKDPGLGTDFVRAVDALLATVERHPAAFPAIRGPVRRALVRRFPYALFYVSEPTRVYVLACLHVSRTPASWPGVP